MSVRRPSVPILASKLEYKREDVLTKRVRGVQPELLPAFITPVGPNPRAIMRAHDPAVCVQRARSRPRRAGTASLDRQCAHAREGAAVVEIAGESMLKALERLIAATDRARFSE